MSSSIYKLYSKLIKSLGNQKRIEIMWVLSDRCATVSELIHMTGMSQANVSQHMQVLRREGVVITKRKGKEIVYCVSHPNFIRLLDFVHEILSDRKRVSPLKKHTHTPHTPRIIDPVCGMSVSPMRAVYTFSYKRTMYYFCASGCRKHFAKNPENYVKS